MKKSILSVICASALTVGVFAARPVLAEAITVGAILPLTGPGAVVGLAEQRGIEFAVAEINKSGGIDGRNLEVVYDDSQGKADLGILAFNKQVDLDGVQAIIGAYSGPTIAMAPLATRKKVLVLNPAAQSDKLAKASPFVVNTIPLTSDEVSVIVDYITKQAKITKAGIIYENSAAGIDSRDDFTKQFKAAGGQVTAEEPVQFGDTNFRPALLKVADTAPQVVFVCITQGHSSFADQVGQQAGFPPVVATTYMTVAMGHPASNGWMNTSIRGALKPEVEAEFKTLYKVDAVNFFHREYYNSTKLLAEVIGNVLKNGQEVTGANLRESLFKTREFDGIAKLVFDTNTADRQVDVMKVVDGKVVPAEASN